MKFMKLITMLSFDFNKLRFSILSVMSVQNKDQYFCKKSFSLAQDDFVFLYRVLYQCALQGEIHFRWAFLLDVL